MAATANMILKITTLADVAGLKAGLDMISAFGGKVVEVMKSVDQFADAHAALSLDVSKMTAATKGMIASQDAYIAANKLSTAGIKASAEQLEGLGKRAVQYAQATGQEVPAALQQMTQAVITGSERGLKPFGINLEGVKTKAEASQRALDQLTESTKNMTIELDSMDDVLGAIGTNISDIAFKFAEIDTSMEGVLGTLVSLNSELTEFNSWMEDSPESTAKWATNIKSILSSVAGDFFNFMGSVAESIGANNNLMGRSLRKIAAGFNQYTSEQNVGYYEERAVEKQVRAAERAARQPEQATRRTSGGGGKKKKREDSRGGKDIYDFASDNVDSMMAAGGEYDQGLINELTGIDLPESVMQRTERILLATKTLLESKRAALEEMRFDLEVEEGSASQLLGIRTEERLAQLQAEKEEREMQRNIDADPRVKAEMLAIEREEELAYYEKSTDFAQQYGDSWENAMKRTSAGAIAATASQNMLRGAVTMAANAMVGSSKMTVKAFAEMVQGIALSAGIEATIHMLMELGHMIAAAVTSWGMSPQIEGHAAAAAQYAVTAAAAFAVAGAASAVAGSRGGSSASPTGTRTGQGNYGSPGYSDVSGGGDKQVNVNVSLHGDAAGVFRVVDEENERRSRNGQTTIKNAA
jgi:hypothetical protein